MFLVFFTLVGDELRLDIVLDSLLIALVIFAVRLLGLLVGAYAGGMLAGDPARHNRVAWLAYVTQAGIGLGLAREVAVEFPQFGEEFATLIVSVIVISQFVGPPLLNFALKRVGEAHVPAQAEPDAVRDALILGIGSHAQALAQQLLAHNWQVTMVDCDPEQVERVQDMRIAARLIPEASAAALKDLVKPTLDALVVMTGQDDWNLRACELAYEIGVPRMVARLNDYAQAEKFTDLGVHVVNPSSAMVHLLDQFVRSPHTAALVMEEEPGDRQIAQITITGPQYDNIRLRDLRLPDDILVLGILREGTSILPHGHTILKLRDEVTLIGSPASLEQITLRMGF